jgi:molybdate transport system substrate-binding protein
MRNKLFGVCLSAGIMIGTAGPAPAAQINFLAASALQPAMQVIIPDFQKQSGHTVLISYAPVGTMTKRIRGGEPLDLSVSTAKQWDDLRNEGKLMPDVRVQFARVGIGIAVKRGEQRPDIGSADALKRTLLGVKSVAIDDPKGSPAGAAALRLFERLGIAADMKPKIKLMAGPVDAIQAVATGGAELGITEANRIADTRGVEGVGQLPEELQSYTDFVAGVPSTAKQIDAAKALANYLKSPAAAEAFKAKAVEPQQK